MKESKELEDFKSAAVGAVIKKRIEEDPNFLTTEHAKQDAVFNEAIARNEEANFGLLDSERSTLLKDSTEFLNAFYSERAFRRVIEAELTRLQDEQTTNI